MVVNGGSVWIPGIESCPRSGTGAASTRTPTVTDVYKVVAYPCTVPEAGAVVGKKIGDDHSGTCGLYPVYPGWESRSRHGTKDGRTEASRGKSEVRALFDRVSHSCIIITHTVVG